MVTFILALYIAVANGLVIPEAIWTISWVLFALKAVCVVAKAIVEAAK